NPLRSEEKTERLLMIADSTNRNDELCSERALPVARVGAGRGLVVKTASVCFAPMVVPALFLVVTIGVAEGSCSNLCLKNRKKPPMNNNAITMAVAAYT